MHSINNYIGDNSTVDFAITFTDGYIKEADVSVTVNNAAVSFTFFSELVVRLAVAPATGDLIQIKRTTQINAGISTFSNNLSLNATDMTNLTKQNRLLAQEQLDKNLYINHSVPNGAVILNGINVKLVGNIIKTITKGYAWCEVATPQSASVNFKEIQEFHITEAVGTGADITLTDLDDETDLQYLIHHKEDNTSWAVENKITGVMTFYVEGEDSVGSADTKHIIGLRVDAASQESSIIFDKISGDINSGNTEAYHTGFIRMGATKLMSFTAALITNLVKMVFDIYPEISTYVAPTTDKQFAPKKYVDDIFVGKVSKAGDSMTGALAMGTNKITGLGDPTANKDGANKEYVDDEISSAVIGASGTTYSYAGLRIGSERATYDALAGNVDLSTETEIRDDMFAGGDGNIISMANQHDSTSTPSSGRVTAKTKGIYRVHCSFSAEILDTSVSNGARFDLYTRKNGLAQDLSLPYGRATYSDLGVIPDQLSITFSEPVLLDVDDYLSLWMTGESSETWDDLKITHLNFWIELMRPVA